MGCLLLGGKLTPQFVRSCFGLAINSGEVLIELFAIIDVHAGRAAHFDSISLGKWQFYRSVHSPILVVRILSRLRNGPPALRSDVRQQDQNFIEALLNVDLRVAAEIQPSHRQDWCRRIAPPDNA